jgi:TRAP-type C4-dicarboxylate transport system permease small subunit
MISRIVAILERVEEALLVFVLTAMVATIGAQVLARYVFNVPLSWTEELARYLFIWLVFLGASQAMRRNEHIAVGLLADRLPFRVRQINTVLLDGLVAGFLLMLVIMGWRVVQVVAPLQSIALKVSMAVVYLPLVVGGAVMVLRTVAHMVKVIRHGPERTATPSL